VNGQVCGVMSHDGVIKNAELSAGVSSEERALRPDYSDSEFLRYLQETERAIGPAEEPKLFRAPGGVAWPRQVRLARAQGYTYVLGSAYPHDPMHPPAWYITWLIEKNLAPGTIVIL
jgi:hypothetical protein